MLTETSLNVICQKVVGNADPVTSMPETHSREFEWNSDIERDLPLWRESFSVLELALLHLAPVYWGLGQPLGDGSGIVLIPGFLFTDHYLTAMYAWLHRMGYRPYFSGIGLNSDCPNLIIRQKLNETIDRAVSETGRKVHIIGHSLGGLLAIAASAQRSHDIASVIALGSPIRGNVCHPNVLRVAEEVRQRIVARHGDNVLPACYTKYCGCDFVSYLTRSWPSSVQMTAVYSKTDAVVDWRYCLTGDPEVDFEIPGTHLGMVVNPSVYTLVAKRLAAVTQVDKDHSPVT